MIGDRLTPDQLAQSGQNIDLRPKPQIPEGLLRITARLSNVTGPFF